MKKFDTWWESYWGTEGSQIGRDVALVVWLAALEHAAEIARECLDRGDVLQIDAAIRSAAKSDAAKLP